MNENRDRIDVLIKQVFQRMKKLNPNPESCPDDQLLAAYHEGGMTREETKRIEMHLLLCERCTENISLLSEVKDSSSSDQQSHATKEMVQRAKDLIPPLVKPSLGERFSQWLSAFRPFPTFATASGALLVLIFSIYSLYSPNGSNGTKPGLISLSIIAGVPSGGVTRGKTPIYKDAELQEGSVLRSGDRFRIKFELQEGAYVCLLSLNSQGDLAKIFPGKATSSLFRAEPGVTYFVPRDEGWFELDDNKGVEKIYLLVSADAIGGIDQKIDRLKESGIDKIVTVFPGTKIQSLSFKHE